MRVKRMTIEQGKRVDINRFPNFHKYKKECAIGTFSRRGAVASATIYHCAECASLQALLAFME